MFWKSSDKSCTIDKIELEHLKAQVVDMNTRLKDAEHELVRLDGYIRSLRGAVNRMKGSLPEEEDIKTPNPTEYLSKL